MTESISTLQDIRGTERYLEANALYEQLRQPGTGRITSGAEVNASSSGRYAAFAGTMVDKLEGIPATRICQVDLETADRRVLTFGPNTDRLPKYSPDEKCIAFLSDRHKAGDFQLYLLDRESGGVEATPNVDGWVEYLHWSPDGRQILLGVAGHEADYPGGQGVAKKAGAAKDVPSWIPFVDSGEMAGQWRSVWIFDLRTASVRRVSKDDCNIWEAAWCGNGEIAAIASPHPGEGYWYSAGLVLIDLRTGVSRELYRPTDQLGWVSGSPSGHHVAVVEAVCSDRWVVAGELRLIDVETARVRQIDTQGVDVTHTEWRSDSHLLVAGHRSFETVVATVEEGSGAFTEAWRSEDLTTGGFYCKVSGVGDAGDCCLIGETFVRAPEIALIRSGDYQPIKSLSHSDIDAIKAISVVERLRWNAPDGLEIQGWLLRPQGPRPFPLIMNVHGGPVLHSRSTWLGRVSVHLLMLIERGYAIFFPNPRGSSGRGQGFIRRVIGDVGGADTHDYLSGIDYLVERGMADPKRLGVLGGSYGGFIASWLITQDPRFAAAVSIAPVNNWVTEHLIGNIPHCVSLYLADTYINAGGKYYSRSPIMHAHKARTPTLNICGAFDRCTPPEEAVQFHNALLENGVESVLVTYPEEGHGVRKFPAAIDYAARIVAWFEEHMAGAETK